MRLRLIQCFCMVAAVTVFGFGFGPQMSLAAEESAPLSEEDIEILASGPIHEAFAEPVALDPEPGIVAPKAPPALIEEIPPEQKPEGDAQWVPGYWAWDDEGNEYIWVSGVWRVPPPGRQWVPGYWSPVTEGYQWISGYWASVTAKEAEYLPEPPESVEVGPSSNAPSSDYTWIPGCWIWQHGRYAWRPGYWAALYPDWIWVPDHYIWTPRGYIFVTGYWDYTVIHRGVLFAPVLFRPGVHLGLTFSFSPSFVIDLSVFDDALFLRPRYCHYYYGDYYAAKYYKNGIYPWFSLHARRVDYDPIFAHQRWSHRNDHEWENRLQTRFRERREHEGLRPARSFDYRTGHGEAGGSSRPEQPSFVTPLNRAGKTKAGPYTFKPLTQKDRREFSQREKELRTYQRERESRETQPLRMLEERGPRKPEPNRERFSRSPIWDRSNLKRGGRQGPPARYRAPEPNPNVEPLERNYGLSRSRGRSPGAENREQKPQIWDQRALNNLQKSGERGGRSEEHNSNNWQQRRDEGWQRGNRR
jgi:hypothetical protein